MNNGFTKIMSNPKNPEKLKGTKCKFCNVICNKKNCINRNCAMYQIHKAPSYEDIELPDYSKILGNNALVKLISDLVTRCIKMESEIAALKQKTNTKSRIQILDVLNDVTNIPKAQFCAWFRKIIITREILLSVFENDLNEGIKNAILQELAIKNEFKTKKKNSPIPIQSFVQKPNCLYIYDCIIPTKVVHTDDSNESTPTTTPLSVCDNTIVAQPNNQPKWSIMPQEYMEKMVSHISTKILAEFIVWQDENRLKIKQNEIMQNDEINYMTKINGYGTTIEKRSVEIKKWLFGKISQDIQPMMKPEFI